MNKERRVTIAIAAMFVTFPIQYAINAAILTANGLPVPLFRGVYETLLNFTVLAAAGVVSGIIVSALRRELRFHLGILRSWRWIATTIVLVAGVSMVGFLYGMLKISVHLVRSTTYDALLWEIDRGLMLGISPNVFLLELLAQPLFYRTFDKLYAFAFFATMSASFLLIFGWRDSRDRIGYLAGTFVLWLVGAWLYFAVPSLGPAYAFYGVWDDVRSHFPTTMAIQKALLNNHLRVLEMARGARGIPIHIQMGIAAFPSLHVAFHAYVAFWLQRLVPKLRLVGWLLVVVMFIGSVITGWHYMIDSVAGIVIAWMAWRVGAWVAGPKTAAPDPEKQNPEFGMQNSE